MRGKPVTGPVTRGGRQANQIAQRLNHQRDIGTNNFQVLKALVRHHEHNTENNQNKRL
jgi:hypothetical protein